MLTTISSRIIQHLYVQHASDDAGRVLYYYVRPGILFSDVAMTFLSQLCCERDDLTEELRLQLIAIEAASGHDRSESVLSALKLTINTAPSTVLIIADGLDEFQGYGISQFLDFVLSLRSEPRTSRARILVSSRALPGVYNFAGGSEIIHLTDQVASDIELLIEDRLHGLEFRDWPDNFKAHFKGILAAHARGRHVKLRLHASCTWQANGFQHLLGDSDSRGHQQSNA